MNRRAFITLLGGGAAAWPVAASAQQPGRTYRLGFFLPVARDAPAIIAFFDELRVHGFVEGQNLAIIPGGWDCSASTIGFWKRQGQKLQAKFRDDAGVASRCHLRVG